MLVVLLGGCGSGSGSPGGDGGRTCQQLASDYKAAFGAALACTPGAANQCQAPVPVSLCAGCAWYVNDATQVVAVLDQFSAQGCDKSDPADCMFVSCPQAGPFICASADGGAPYCMIAPPTTN